ncbi:right-handed parallel beta-helix repeat-containing protein [Lewinella sp. JB7]|uniref:right-handed parallel beta-helix repeat-containing protein n=1 Tax=Lewinella sp. JB7 TaxID=2962887 RepID=UPI0020C99091|nr:right-handed parallel beta-helix repeat-containing protein [Lewinella sp. JB7]MCP9236142.1 right-handed parallel beta-helix repeat-containing protein [Lewinella sp. JB7]
MALGRLNNLYFNGQLMDLARWPNNVDRDPYTIDATPVNGGTAGTIDLADTPPADWTGGYIWYLGAHSGTSWTRSVTNITGRTVSFEAVDIDKWPFNPHNPTLLRNGNRGRAYLVGAFAALDHEREWYFDGAGNILYFIPPDGAAPHDGTAEYTAREHTVLLEQPYVHVKGIKTFGGKVQIKASHCVIEDNVIAHGLHMIDELDNTSAQVGSGSVHVQAENTVIRNNLIEYGSHNGIFVQGWGGVADVTIEENEIHDFNTVGIHSSPVRANCERAIVTHNTIYTTGRDGVYLPGHESEFAYNDVYDCMRINNDGGMYYVVGNANRKDGSIHHNWFHDSSGPEYADGRTAGIYLDNNSKGYSVHHNMVWNISWSAVQMNWDASYNDIINNSFYRPESAMGIWLNGYSQRENRVINNFSTVGEWEGQTERHNLIADTDPFVDRAGQDFRPAPGSSLIDSGTEVAGYTEGFTGAAPDIGAYESGGQVWIPGALRADNGTTGLFAPVALPRSIIALYPNPASTVTYAEFTHGGEGAGEWMLLATDGKIARRGQQLLRDGTNRIRISTAGLPAGSYRLTGRSHQATFTGTVVVP